jgi:polysaccharide export outer membrane protein
MSFRFLGFSDILTSVVRLSAIVFFLAALSAGCSSNNAGREKPGELYGQDQLGAFVEDTDPLVSQEDYVIGIGDRLDVVFFVHKELTTVDLLVRSDGRITLPYVGDVDAAGVTPMQLDSTLSYRFSEVLREPNLSVILREPAEKLVYVLGQVKTPGGFPYQTKLSVVQALALAGGMDRGAKTTHVLVIRRKGPEKVVGIEVNVASITSGYNVQSDIWLRNYDILYVPKTRLQSAGEFIAIINDILFPPVDLVLRGWQIEVLRQQLEVIRARN